MRLFFLSLWLCPQSWAAEKKTPCGDPLAERIMEVRLADEAHGGIVSALRIRGKNGRERIVYTGGEKLLDSPGPKPAGLGLPASKVSRRKPAAEPAAIEMKTLPAGQANVMRKERKSLGRGEAESRDAAGRMFGN
jgi:hypothetical protein